MLDARVKYNGDQEGVVLDKYTKATYLRSGGYIAETYYLIVDDEKKLHHVKPESLTELISNDYESDCCNETETTEEL